MTLIANSFEGHDSLGPIRQNALSYAGASRCRWIKPDVDIVLRGPKEFADQYGADASTMLWFKHGDMWEKIGAEAITTDLPDGPSFDSKMALAEELLPDSRAYVRAISDLLRSDWQHANAFERHLSDRLPHLHAALERGRHSLLLRVLTQDSADRGIEQLRLDAGQYEPYLGHRRLRALGAGSDPARLVGAYTLALAAASVALKGLHPGVVILDEPLQRNPDEQHLELLPDFLSQDLAKNAKFQTLVLTYLSAKEVKTLRDNATSAITVEGHLPPLVSRLEALPIRPVADGSTGEPFPAPFSIKPPSADRRLSRRHSLTFLGFSD